MRAKIKSIIREKATEFRGALDEQYDLIFKAMADIAVKLPASDVGRPLPSTAAASWLRLERRACHADGTEDGGITSDRTKMKLLM